MNPALVTLHVWRVPRAAVPRALARMAVDPRRLRALPGVRFGKLLGTGTGTSFGVRDADLTRYAALTVWDDADAAADFDAGAVGRAWGRLAVSSARLDLIPVVSRGRWSGVEPFGTPAGPQAAGPTASDPTASGPTVSGRKAGGRKAAGPVVALTRARLRPRRAATFWRAVPPVAAALAGAPGLLARFGIGEAPVGWQGTVSVWRSTTELTDFAYRHPEHRAVIDRTPVDRWYAEDLFARFTVRDVVGDPAVLGWVDSAGVQLGRTEEENTRR